MEQLIQVIRATDADFGYQWVEPEPVRIRHAWLGLPVRRYPESGLLIGVLREFVQCGVQGGRVAGGIGEQ